MGPVVFTGKFLRVMPILCVFLAASSAAWADTSVADQSVRSALKSLLARDRDLSEAHRRALANVIDRYVPQCQASRFKLQRVEDALHIRDQGDGSFVVTVDIACDPSKDKPQMRYVGQRIVVNGDGSLRGRNDLYQPSAEFAAQIRAAERRVKAEAAQEPSEQQIRKAQIARVLKMLDDDASISSAKKRVYRRLVREHYPSCPETGGDIQSIRDAVWLRAMDKGYIAVMLVVCDWKDGQAFRLDANGRVMSAFSLPLGKYGFSPMPRMKVADLTGDGDQEFYFAKIFPTSSVPVFSRRTQIYKLNAETVKMVRVFDLETELQDCFAASRNQGKMGDRTLVTLSFKPQDGRIEATRRKEKIDCDDFSWGDKPARVESVSSTSKSTFVWDRQAFRFVGAPR